MRIAAAIMAAVAVLAGAARAEDLPDQRPILRIEPGMHPAAIFGVGIDAACSLMVTGSDDKTTRLWSLPKGVDGRPEFVRVLRTPIGDGFKGRIIGVALSPNGRWVAAASWSDRSNSVYIFDAATGQVVERLGDFHSHIWHLSFSSDGSRLVAVIKGGEGMRLWDTGNWRLLAEDKDYAGQDSYGAAFDNENRLYTVAFDGKIRRYSADGHLQTAVSTQGGKKPYSLSISSKGGKLALTFRDTASIEIYDTQTLGRLYAVDMSGLEATTEITIAAWSADGLRLYAVGYSATGRSSPPIYFWGGEGRGGRAEVSFSTNTVTGILPCGNGIAAAAADPAFGIIFPDSPSRTALQHAVTVYMLGKKRKAFTLSADAKRLRFGLGYGDEQPFLFDLAAFRLTEALQAIPNLAEPKISGLAVADWENAIFPQLNGKPLGLGNREMSHALAIAPDASRFVLGTEFWLRAYRADGSELWKKQAPGVAWGVNISGDGRLVVAAYDDGTIRWHRLSDGQELLALFVHAKDRRFVAWTPKGYYAASPGAEDLIGWHVNRDWDHAPDFFPASRFRDQFNRPDIVKRVLGDLDEDKAIAEANRLADVRQAEEIPKRLPPVVAILEPGEGDAFASDSLTVRYSLHSPSGLPVTEISALVDGRPLPGATIKELITVSPSEDIKRSITLTGLPPRKFTLSLQARSGNFTPNPSAGIALKFTGTPPVSAPKRSLYVLAIGVGKFKDPKVDKSHHLNWADNDASEFAATLKRQEGRGLYDKVEVKFISQEKADNASIIDGLTWLDDRVKSLDDTGILFLSGHGSTDASGDYHYVPYNAKFQSVEGRLLPVRSTMVPDTEIGHALARLNGKALFFFDTCFAGIAAGSGSLDYNKLINGALAANIVVLSSSKGDALSHERDEWKHGAFTKALLEGLEGKAPHRKSGIVRVDELTLYVKDRVEELTGRKQIPVDLRPHPVENFDFAMVP
ncbi:MAG: caspase family protein [Rhodomicrobium sp.]